MTPEPVVVERAARTEVVHADLLDHLRTSARSNDVICLDIDNGPEWTVTDRTRDRYDDAGTALAASRLKPGGVASIWSAARSPSYEEVLARRFGRIEVLPVPVARGEPDVVILASRSG